MSRALSYIGLIIAALISVGCSAVVKADRYAAGLGFEKTVVEGKGFRHVVYANSKTGSSGIPLNVYIEGDGVPWVLGRYVAKNPTGETLMLRLMAQDSSPAIYLGRPCYFGLHQDAGCDSKYWSSDRYSAAVADSMAAALARIEADRAVNLLGHSGGGALAVLLARRVPKVKSVVTVAGNLDIDAWTGSHRYDPLTGSLNPRLQPPLPPSVIQLHVAGGKDKNVQTSFIEDFARAQPGAMFRLYPEQSHACCWEEVWTEILAILSQK